MIDKCCLPRCRNISDLRYIGREICAPHWEQLCEGDSKTENRLLRKVGLKRSETGQVMEVKKDEEEEED